MEWGDWGEFKGREKFNAYANSKAIYIGLVSSWAIITNCIKYKVHENKGEQPKIRWFFFPPQIKGKDKQERDRGRTNKKF